MIGIILALALTQVRADVIGSLNTMETAIREARQGQRTVTRNAARTRVCVQPATTIPAGAKTIRYGVAMATSDFQRLAGFALPPGAATWADSGDEMIAFEIQYLPTTEVTFDRRLWVANMDVIEEEVEMRATPVQAACEVAMVRRDDAAFGSVVRCACAPGPACLWDPDGAGTGLPASAAPLGVTLAPGTFSGACQPKACVTRFMGAKDESWPSQCPR